VVILITTIVLIASMTIVMGAGLRGYLLGAMAFSQPDQSGTDGQNGCLGTVSHIQL